MFLYFLLLNFFSWHFILCCCLQIFVIFSAIVIVEVKTFMSRPWRHLRMRDTNKITRSLHPVIQFTMYKIHVSHKCTPYQAQVPQVEAPIAWCRGQGGIYVPMCSLPKGIPFIFFLTHNSLTVYESRHDLVRGKCYL